jgi:hypothetical protein
MRLVEIRRFCRLPEEGQRLMRAAMTQLNLLVRLSSYSHTGAHNRRPVREGGDPVGAPGRGAAVSAKIDDELMGSISARQETIAESSVGGCWMVFVT